MSETEGTNPMERETIENGGEKEARRGIKRFWTALAVALPILLAVALGVVCVYATERASYAESLERRAEAMEREAYYALHDNVNDLQTALSKLQITASSARHVELLSDVWRLSGAAAVNLSNLPVSHAETAELNALIVRIGDYADSLIARVLSGGMLQSADYEQLDALHEASVRIGNEIKARLDADDFPTYTQDGYYAVSDGAAGGNTTGEAGQAGASDEGKNEDAIANYPTLIYDGPFSESNETAAPRGLPGADVDEYGAQQAALAWLGGGSISLLAFENGTIPAYTFMGTDAFGQTIEITVTRQGGKVLRFMAEREAAEDAIPSEEETKRLSEAARAYLAVRGYPDMTPAYAQFYGGAAVFNFAAMQDGVILYADLVKVYVWQADARIVGADMTNYLMRHTTRDLPAPTMTEAEAANAVSENLKVESVALALIPKTAADERLCYEFKGKRGETSFIVYINAVTGAEEEIFQIIDSDRGQLVV